MKTRYYQVGGHAFSVTTSEGNLLLMGNYEPFSCDSMDNPVFSLTIGEGSYVEFTEELRQEEEGQKIVCGKTADGHCVFEYSWRQETAGWLVCTDDYHEGRLIISGCHRKMAIDNSLMVMYALSTACLQTLLFHAAVVSHNDRAYMFLGKSGTGKSTHARLWLKHVKDAILVNDDNPVVRISSNGIVTLYGSPWSGKTPCYRPVSYPLGGMVMLSQAPYNRIRRLTGIEAYAVLVPSISGKRWDGRIAEGLHQSENTLASRIPIWHLECLPDEEAARICEETISKVL